jgi:hypothetical protein
VVVNTRLRRRAIKLLLHRQNAKEKDHDNDMAKRDNPTDHWLLVGKGAKILLKWCTTSIPDYWANVYFKTNFND